MSNKDEAIRNLALLSKLEINYSNVLGQGSYGNVYEGKMKGSFQVAIKVVYIEENDETKLTIHENKIKLESAISKNLMYKYIIKTLSVEHKKTSNSITTFYVMEKAPNKNLNTFIQYLNKTNFYNIGNYISEKSFMHNISENVAKYFIYQLCYALEFCYSNNIVHFDIKPENILIGQKFISKLCDFSTSCDVNLKSDELYALKVGTISYMGPEYYKNNKMTKKNLLDRIDLFSTGLIIYYIFFKKHLIDRDEINNVSLEKVIQNLNRVHKDIKECNFLSDECKNLTLKLLDEDLAKRPSIYEVLNEKWINDDHKLIMQIYDIYQCEGHKFFLELQKSNLISQNGKKVKPYVKYNKNSGEYLTVSRNKKFYFRSKHTKKYELKDVENIKDNKCSY